MDIIERLFIEDLKSIESGDFKFKSNFEYVKDRVEKGEYEEHYYSREPKWGGGGRKFTLIIKLTIVWKDGTTSVYHL